MARRPVPPSPSPTPAQEPNDVGALREARGARRKRETRDKLLQAAFRLFSERGADSVAINELTEAADVGFGSFYNHFASKDAIYEAVVDVVFGEFGDMLDRATADVADPAEVIAISIRSTIHRAHAEPLWGAFFLREGLSAAAMTRGLGSRLLRDLRRAVDAGRLAPEDASMALMLAGGCVLAAIAADAAVTKYGAPAAHEVGIDGTDLPARAAAAVLAALGLARTEAVAISQKPLPTLTP